MGQGRDVVPAGAWAEARDKAEVEWVGLLPQDRVEIAYARNVVIRFHILQANRVAKEPARNAERKCQDNK